MTSIACAQDYATPEGKVLSRDLTHVVNIAIQFLVECRPLSVSMGNAIKYLKLQVRTENCFHRSDHDYFHMHACMRICCRPTLDCWKEVMQECQVRTIQAANGIKSLVAVPAHCNHTCPPE